MKHSWFIPLTPKQAAILKDGLKSVFRFQLSLAVETVVYSKKNNTLTVNLVSGISNATELLMQISCYINGFSKAIEKQSWHFKNNQ